MRTTPKLTARAMVAILAMLGSAALAADMPEKWLAEHKTAPSGQTPSLLVTDDKPVCTDFSSPETPCCMVLWELPYAEQIAFIQQHPHCYDGGGSGGDNRHSDVEPTDDSGQNGGGTGGNN